MVKTKDMERRRKTRLPHKTRRRMAERGITRLTLRAIIVAVSRSIYTLVDLSQWLMVIFILQHASSSAMGRDPLAPIARDVLNQKPLVVLIQITQVHQNANLTHFHVAVDQPSISNSSPTPSPSRLGRSSERYPGHVRALQQRRRSSCSHFVLVLAAAQVLV